MKTLVPSAFAITHNLVIGLNDSTTTSTRCLLSEHLAIRNSVPPAEASTDPFTQHHHIQQEARRTRIEMASYGLLLVVLVSLAYLNTVCPVQGEALNSMEILEKPQRPRVFTSPEDLKSYLGALGRYYATAGRNRFGKRSLRGEGGANGFSPVDIYDILQSEK